MDPVTAVGLVANISQFVELGTKIVSTLREIRGSASGQTDNNRRTREMADAMRNLSNTLANPKKNPQTDAEKDLCRLATECSDLSQQILDIVDKAMRANPSTRFKNVRATFWTVRYDGKKEDLEKKLSQCRSQLGVHLSYITSQHTIERLTALATDAEFRGKNLETLDEHVQQLNKGVTIASFDENAQHQLRALLELPATIREEIAQRMITRSLAFADMHSRFNTVETAHSQTFSWILEESSNQDGVQQLEARRRFLKWLSGEDGIFHIAGKLGSGKSTLLKFLFCHQRTTQELQTWAGSRKLVVAECFFWKPGSALQKSLGGLMRTILYEILQSRPELTSIAFPNRWKSTMEGLSKEVHYREHSSMADDDIQAACQRIATDLQISGNYRFCLFLDALDEYEGSHRIDNKAMVDWLKEWARSSRGAIKLCVSSREESVFQDAFSADRRIRMQDLTKTDMQTYVVDMVQDWDHMRARTDIVDQILDRSDGIFLWVILVVKKLRECLGNEESLEQFSRDLERLPRDLEPLFDYLLDSIRKAGRTKKAWQMFKLVGALNASVFNSTRSMIPKMPIVSYLFLECLEKSPDFAVLWSEQRLHEVLSKHQDQNLLSPEALESKAQKLIQAWCKGLVEVRDFDTPVPPGSPAEVEERYRAKYALFTHRSIPEFLESRKTGVDAKEAEGNFANTMSQLLLATLKCTTRNYIPYVWWAHLTAVVVGVHHHLGQDMAALSFLAHFEGEVYKHLPLCNPPIADNIVMILPGSSSSADDRYAFAVWSIRRDLIVNLQSHSETSVRSVIASPVAVLATSWDPEHIDQILSQNPTLLETEARRALLLASLVARVLYVNPSKTNMVPKLVDCIERKLLSRPIPRQVNTLWSDIVLQYVLSGLRQDVSLLDRLDRSGILIAAFLRAYRKPLLSTTVSQVSISKEEQESGDKAEPPGGVKFIYLVELQDNEDEQFSAVRQDIVEDLGFTSRSLAPNAHPFPPLNTTWTLRSLIERFNFRKRNEILRLMDEIEGVPYTASSLGCYTTTTCGETGCENPDHTVPWYPLKTIDPNATTKAVDDNLKLPPEPLAHEKRLSRVLTLPNLLRISPALVLLLAVVLRLAYCAITTSC